jgi:PAS domain S-box-containing protein
MDQIRSTDGSTSLVALFLVFAIGVTTLLLLPRRDHANQLFWVVPCLTLSLVEAITDNVDLSRLAEIWLVALGGVVVAVALSRRAQATLGQSTALPVAILTCIALISAGPIVRLLGMWPDAGMIVDVASLLAACCWPMLTPSVFECMRVHRARLAPFVLMLVYAISVLTPEFDDFPAGSGFYYLEAASHFLGVLVGFVSSALALRQVLRDNRLLAASERVARLAQEETSKFLRALIDTAPAAVYVKDLDGRYKLVNKVAAQWIDRPEATMLGNSDFDIFPPEVARAVRELDALVVATGTAQNREMPLRSKGDPIERLVMNYKFPLFDVDGKLTALAGLALDITRNKAYERELIAAKLTAEEANRAKSNFLAHMSHELRTPLNAIIGFSEVIHKGVFGRDKFELYQQYAGDIHSAGKLLLSQVNDLLDISRVEAGTFDVNLESIDLEAVAEDCRHLLHDQAERRSVKLAIDAGRPLPQVVCDRRATLQVLVNLVGNAIKYVPQGSIVNIAGGKTESGVPYLMVEDNGPGLPSEVLQALLDPWTHQSAVITQDGRGGMGLLLSRRLIEVQGGRLFIESSPGKGTRVACQFMTQSRDSGIARSKGA